MRAAVRSQRPHYTVWSALSPLVLCMCVCVCVPWWHQSYCDLHQRSFIYYYGSRRSTSIPSLSLTPRLTLASLLLLWCCFTGLGMLYCLLSTSIRSLKKEHAKRVQTVQKKTSSAKKLNRSGEGGRYTIGSEKKNNITAFLAGVSPSPTALEQRLSLLQTHVGVPTSSSTTSLGRSLCSLCHPA